jgi:ABC-2 type transport system ATP-binding protein
MPEIRVNDSSGDTAILIEGLTKSFGEVKALRGIDMVVPRGSVLSVLGPNGAGKTTMIKILTTLLRPDSGRALIEGFDVVREPRAVRRIIGLAGQSPAIHEELTARENLEIVARLYHLGKGGAVARARELLERFDLTDVANRSAKTYSGGMKRRLDLAASLVGRPAVLFLDEPTAGLDPAARISMWSVVRELVSAGTTLLLTTQYLEEADALADQVAVINHGQVIVADTPEQLKNRIGGDVLEFTVTDPARVGTAVEAVSGSRHCEVMVDAESGRIGIGIGADASAVVDVVRRLDAAGITFASLSVRSPSLDDVFLAVTGRAAASATSSPEQVCNTVGSSQEGA